MPNWNFESCKLENGNFEFTNWKFETLNIKTMKTKQVAIENLPIANKEVAGYLVFSFSKLCGYGHRNDEIRLTRISKIIY